MNNNLKLDINNWKEFKITDLFYVEKGKEIISNTEEGDIPLISATENNNGITKFILNGVKLFKENKITIASNGSVGETFFQNKSFYATTDINVLTSKFKVNKLVYLFFVFILKNEKYKFSYGRKWGIDRLEKTIIKLPTTPHGEPDFEFMENYIKNIYDKLEKKIISKNKTKNKIELKIENWKEFNIGDLFEVKLSKGDLKLSQLNSGNIKLISAISNDNGIIGFIDSEGDGKAEIFDKNSITIDMFCNVFYQNEKFYSVSHGRVNILVPNFSLNKYIGLFFTTLLQNEIYRFSYGRAVYSEEAKNLIIKLPTTPQGEPDFEFMENYIKSLPYGDLI